MLGIFVPLAGSTSKSGLIGVVFYVVFVCNQPPMACVTIGGVFLSFFLGGYIHCL